MKKTAHTLIFFILLFGAFLTQSEGAGTSPAYVFSEQELDNLLAPIALYPDPLLAVMLPASTYPAEIADADAWFKRGGTVSGIDGQSWAESVKAVAYYPNILKMVAGNLGWTADLGDAFLNQPEDVTRSIQRLRWEAREAGNLESNDKQQVIIDGDNIEIIPAQPDYMYVPQYDDSVVYDNSWAPGSPPFVTYGLGLAIGGWLSMDFDWRQHHVIYHGWNRPGWVNHARPYVHVPNVYVNRSRPSINQTWRHDVSHGDPERFRASQPGHVSVGTFAHTPEVRGRETTKTNVPGVIFGPRGDANAFSNRGRQSLGTINQRPSPPAAAMSRQPATPTPHISSGSAPPRPAGVMMQPPKAPPAAAISRQPATPTPHISSGSAQPRPAGIVMQPSKTPSVTFGGYRGGNEARAQSVRGEASRQSSAAPRPSAAPASGKSAPAGRSSSGGKPSR
ncbi:MAG: DUF3300 domain-containing protein [Syntrophales bacterium]